MSYTKPGIRVWDPTEAVSIHGASSAQANSLNNRIVAQFPDAATRNGAYPGVALADMAGTLAWQVSHSSYVYHDGTTWQYMPQHQVLFWERSGTSQDVNSTTPAMLISTGNFVLPGGNRKIEIQAASIATGVTGGTGFNPRVFMSGSGFGPNDYVGQTSLTGVGDVFIFARTWFLRLAGTVTWQMNCLNASGTGYSRFHDSNLTIIDHGAADF